MSSIFSPLKIQLLIWSYLQFLLIKKLYFNYCKIDCVMSLIALHLNLRFLQVHFSVLIRFLVVHVTSNPKEFLYANFSNIVGRDIILTIEYTHFSCYNLTTPMQFHSQNLYAH